METSTRNGVSLPGKQRLRAADRGDETSSSAVSVWAQRGGAFGGGCFQRLKVAGNALFLDNKTEQSDAC